MAATSEDSTLRDAPPSRLTGREPIMTLHVAYSPDRESVARALELKSDQPTLVGRDVENGLRIRDPKMSRLHSRIAWDAMVGAFRLSDAGSANGTIVNGHRLQSALLKSGDVARVGDSLIVVAGHDAVEQLHRDVERAATSHATVLIRGETGTGKELVARSIHELSQRAGPLVPVNCAALPTGLAAAELFGHTRGAFSGAGTQRAGLVRAANAGTLFLDEIGDLPNELQPQLLRVLEEKTVRPVGSDHEVRVDVRVLAATHVDLERAVTEGRFREDLLARLVQLVIEVPPLRARRTRILSLVREFAPGLELAPNVAEALLIAEWSRNVRELRGIVESFGPLLRERDADLSDLGRRLPSLDTVTRRSSADELAVPPSAQRRREEIGRLLREHDGNIAEVARRLGTTRAQVYRWIRSLGLTRKPLK